MKAKLVKEYGDFYLISDKEIQKGDEYVKLDNRPRMLLLGTTIASAKVSKLSLKNCQAIECGYDLEELVKSVPHTCRNDEDWYKCRAGFIVGFQTAMEILGDKKFSEDDIKEAMLNALEMTAYQIEQFRKDNKYHIATDIIQSLQQTEWDVYIVEEESHEYNMCSNPKDHVSCLTPKLDADGCLILKRK